MIRAEREKGDGAQAERRRSRFARTPTTRSRRSTRSLADERRIGVAAPNHGSWKMSAWATRSGQSSRARCASPTWWCWHIGMGMGLYGVKALRLGYDQRQRMPRFFRPDALNIPDVQQRVHWDPEWARAAGQPHELRLRPYARNLAHPSLYRLDGRRRVALEARLSVPQVQLRGRHALDARTRPRGPTAPRTADRRQTSTCGARTNGARPPHPVTRRFCCRHANTDRCGSPTRPEAPPTVRKCSTRSRSASPPRRDEPLTGVAPPVERLSRGWNPSVERLVLGSVKLGPM